MNIGSILGDPDFPRLKDYILGFTGLMYYADKDEDLAAKVARRFRATHVETCGAYLRLVRDNAAHPAEIEQLVGELTIGETYFFRQPEHFELLRTTIVPDLLRRNQDSRRIRIWSAGCATGPEPYSLAILLHTEFAGQIEGWDVSIVATDINVSFLAQAESAEFPAWALRQTPEEIKRTCFERKGNHWKLRSRYRSGVVFRYDNLADDGGIDQAGGPFHLILCRNVLIYFSRERIAKVAARFYASLEEGGWLLVGHAEPNAEIFREFQTAWPQAATAYRRLQGTHGPNLPPAVWTPFEFREEPGEPNPDRPGEAAPPAESPPGIPELEASLERAKALANQGGWEDAMKLVDQVIQVDRLNAFAHLLKALLLDHAGDFPNAIAAFRRALYSDRNLYLAHYHLGAALAQQGQRHDAKKSFQNVLQLLTGLSPEEPIPHGDGITANELAELAKMHLETIP